MFQRKMTFNKTIIISIIVSLLFAVAVLRFIPSSETVRVMVSPGMTASAVAVKLEEKEIIKNARFFLRLLTLLGKDQDIKAGTYYIRPGTNYFSIIRNLSKGSEHLVRVTIPEGFRTEQIAERLYRNNVISDPEEFILMVVKKDLRGFLFPDTYHFPENMPAESVINTMVTKFNSIFSSEWKERAEEMGFSVKEIVTLASLVERETRVPEERPIISDVFHKRLKMRMYLESCASVQFALGENRPRLIYRDLEVDSPYNTYRNFGLPPTPIANPGAESIKAALYPDETEYLFFFEKGGGAHEFSKTYQDHLRKQREMSR